MRTVSRTAIGGVPTPHVVRKSGKSFPNGCGICAKNSASSGSRPRCVSPSFPPPLELKLCHRRTHRRQDHSSVPRSGHVPRASEAWADATFSCRLMARCVGGLGPRSIRRNDAPNTMERCACSMPPAELPVAPVPCVSPVKNTAPPPKNLAVSALSCIPCLSLRQKSRRPWALLLLPLQFIPSGGGIGHARSLAEPGSGGSAATWSPCKLHSIHHLPSR